MSRLVKFARVAFRPVFAQQANISVRRTVAPMTKTMFRTFSTDNDGEPFLDSKQVTDRIMEVVSNFDKVNKANITATALFKEDLDLDSLDAVEIVMLIEEEFSIEIPDSEADKILSIADAVSYVSSHPMAK